MIDAIERVGRSAKLGISCGSSTRYLEVHAPTRGDVKRLGSLQLTCRDPHYPCSKFGRPTRQFKLENTFLGTGRVNSTLTDKYIQTVY